jgi:hypothetical protein
MLCRQKRYTFFLRPRATVHAGKVTTLSIATLTLLFVRPFYRGSYRSTRHMMICRLIDLNREMI